MLLYFLATTNRYYTMRYIYTPAPGGMQEKYFPPSMPARFEEVSAATLACCSGAVGLQKNLLVRGKGFRAAAGDKGERAWPAGFKAEAAAAAIRP